MIDKKELRVGSHVLVDGEVFEVCEINTDCISIIDDGCVVVLDEKTDVQPILIVLELLQEIGFIQSYDCEDYTILSKVINGHKTDVMFFNGNWYVTILELGYPTKQKVQYLHELESYVYLTLHEELIMD